MEKVTKTFVSQIKSIDEKNFTLEAVVSDETVDRYGEVIKVDAWKKRLGNYKSHPVLVTSHNYGKLTNQIGYADKVYVKDGELVCKFKYFVGEGNDEADWGWKLASKFGQAAYSVGFLPFNYERCEEKDYEEAKQGKKPFLTYTDVELLEVSQVLIPANPSALAKSFEKEDDLVIKEYTEMILNRMSDVSFDSMIEEDLGKLKDLEDDIEKRPETTENYHHVPAPGEEGKHSSHKIRTITVSKDQGIKGKYCADCKKIISYMFSTDKWTMDEAKEWVKEHSKAYAFFAETDCLDIGDIEEISNGKSEYTKDCVCGLYLSFFDSPEAIKCLFEYKDVIDEEIRNSDKKPKKPKKPGGCKTYEEEEVKEAVKELKDYIDGKLAPIEDFIKSIKDVDEEIDDEIKLQKEKEELDERLAKEMKEKDELEKEKETESYIRTMINDINKIVEKHIPVQSDEADK